MEKRLIIMVLLIYLFFSLLLVGADGYKNNIMNINLGSTYNSEDLYNISVKLTEKYPNILSINILGNSTDGRPVYSLVLTEDVTENIERDDFNTFRKHYLIEGGSHSREDVNPIIILGIIEAYCIDYYNDSYIKEFSLKEELQRSVIHFIPLANPDGFDLARFGMKAVRTNEVRNILLRIKYKNYSNYKAGMTGVDHNRNYPAEYYDVKKGEWVDIWQRYPSELYSQKPSFAYYAGPYPGSEIEVRLVMDYILKYDFRNVLSYHSRGRVLYWHKYFHTKAYNDRAKRLATRLSNESKYKLMPISDGRGSGYISDFVASNTLKPTITVETLPLGVKLPTEQVRYEEAYKETYLLPLYATLEGEQVGYFKYRLYYEGKYIRDFNDKSYAEAHAKRIGGIVVTGEDIPKMFLTECNN